MTYFTNMNYLAIIVSSVIYLFIGFLWFSKMMFADIWMRQTGITMNPSRKPSFANMAFPMIGQFIGSLLYSFGIDLILNISGKTGWNENRRIY